MTYTSTDPITKARNTIFSSFRVETVPYTDYQGLESDIEVIIDRGGNQGPEIRGYGPDIEAELTMLAQTSDVPDPREGKDTVIVVSPAEEEQKWRLYAIDGGDAGVWELTFKRDLREES